MTIAIDQQAIAVELAALGTQAFIDNMGPRMSVEENARRRRRVEELNAAAKTLHWVHKNEPAIRAALGKGET